MDVSIIIINYNTFDLVKDCINSIYNQTFNLEFEIIVVDNKSPNRDIEMLKGIFPNITLILNNSNSGFGVGNNIGAKVASGRNLFFLNSDTLLINNAITTLSEFLDYNEDVAIAGGNLYNAKLQPATSFSQVMPGIFAEIDNFFGNVFSKILYFNKINFNNTESFIYVKGFISGADMMMKRNVYQILDGFDEDFFMYYEETELSARVKKLGYRIANIPQAKIIHLEGASESIQKNTALRSYGSKFLYFKKTGSLKTLPICRLIFKLAAIQRRFLFLLMGKGDKSVYWSNLFKWESEAYLIFRTAK